MKKGSHKLFGMWLKQQNTHDRVQPIAGIDSITKQVNSYFYRTPQTILLQRLKERQ